MSVSHILGVKGRSVVTANSHESVHAIATKLAQNRIGAVVVVDDDGGIAGIVSGRSRDGATGFRHHEQDGENLQIRRQ
jgi:CBS domain-containing protein